MYLIFANCLEKLCKVKLPRNESINELIYIKILISNHTESPLPSNQNFLCTEKGVPAHIECNKRA